jgi:dolichol-phosphate mannosyltransferase
MLETLMKFGVVGGLGVIVNLGILGLMRWLGFSDTLASAIAIEVSIISNFVFNERWIFWARVVEYQGRGWG